MKTAKVLRKARELISDPKRWTTRYSARDKNGYCVPLDSKTAVSWCAIGALHKVTYERGLPAPVYAAMYRAADLIADGIISTVNDIGDHDLVLWMLDLAIAEYELSEDSK